MKRNLILSEASVAETLQSFVELGIVRKVSLPSPTPTTGVTSNRCVAEGQLRTLRRPPRRRSDAIGADKQSSVSIHLAERECIHLPRNDDNFLLKKVFEEFCPRFAPGGVVVYIGDTARFPYVIKSMETITLYATQITEFLLRQEVKLNPFI